MPTREEQKELRRQQILSTALDLFIKKGYAGTKIADIAKAANMSVGLLFHYYESKEKLYEALIEIGVMGPKSIMKIDSTNPIEFFEKAAREILHYLTVSPFAGKIFVLMIQATYQEPISEKVAELVKQITNVADSVEIIKRGQQLGQIRDGNPAALAVLFWNTIQGIAQAYAMDSQIPLPEAGWIVDMLKESY